MTTFQPTDYLERKESVPPFEIHVVSYKLADTYHCTVDNVSPGAVLARTQGRTREEAENAAVSQAKELLAKTRIVNERHS